MRRLLPLILLALAAARAQVPAALPSAYPLGPDSQVQAVPHGTVNRAVLPPGRFYPGTPHTYAVYLPAHTSAGPLPYMIFLDGSQYLGNGLRTPTVLDNLIAEGKAKLRLLVAGPRPEEIEQARIEVAKNAEAIEFAISRLERDKELFAEKLVSKQDLENSEANLARARYVRGALANEAGTHG